VASSSASIQAREADVLALLRENYEGKGFSFFEHPSRDLVPDFLGHYVPDAIAIGDSQKFAIEVKFRNDKRTEQKLSDLSKLFQGHGDWTFRTYFLSDFESDSSIISTASLDEIREGLQNADRVSELGLKREGFLLYWPVLEALVRSISYDNSSERNVPPLKPGTVVNSLEEFGLLSHDVASHLRPLILKRNKFVHGDLGTDVTAEDAETLKQAIRVALSRLVQELPEQDE